MKSVSAPPLARADINDNSAARADPPSSNGADQVVTIMLLEK